MSFALKILLILKIQNKYAKIVHMNLNTIPTVLLLLQIWVII